MLKLGRCRVDVRVTTLMLKDSLTITAADRRRILAACRREGAGLFCLVKTSNPGSGDVQDVRLSDDTLLWQHVARLVEHAIVPSQAAGVVIGYGARVGHARYQAAGSPASISAPIVIA